MATGIVLVLMLFMIAGNTLLRYGFNAAWNFAEEYTADGLIFMTFIPLGWTLKERGHIEILNNIRQRKGVKAEDIPEVQDLMISDYLVEGDLTDSMNYQDIIILAMKREEKSHNLYTHLAERVTDGDLKNLFLKLASEEAKHKLHFEKIYDDDVLKEN